MNKRKKLFILKTKNPAVFSSNCDKNTSGFSIHNKDTDGHK